MRLVSYLDGEVMRPGVLVDDGVVDVREIVTHRPGFPPDLSYGSVKDIIGTAGLRELDALDQGARAAGEFTKPLGAVTLGPPIPDPQKVLCIGLNYADHINEVKAHGASVGNGDPTVFAMFPTCLIGAGAPIELPKVAPDKVDYEGELGVVIGRLCHRVSRSEALDHVAGYTIVNDVTARDLQLATPQWTMGKAFDKSGPCGPALVTADEIPDPQSLDLTTVLNGDQVQSANTSEMVHPVAELIEYLSAAITLLPGDIIATGTPAGTGGSRDPRLWLKDGDTVTIAIGGLGELTNPVRREGST